MRNFMVFILLFCIATLIADIYSFINAMSIYDITDNSLDIAIGMWLSFFGILLSIGGIAFSLNFLRYNVKTLPIEDQKWQNRLSLVQERVKEEKKERGKVYRNNNN